MKKKGAQILIVDDEEDICELLSRIMKDEGFEPLVAHDGDMALQMIRSETPDVLLTDIRMPGMDGMLLLKRAKEMDPDIPVIIITAYADIHGSVEALRKGAHDYLAKPFDHCEVIRTVRRALSERELKLKVRHLSSQIKEDFSLRKNMGTSMAICQLISEVELVAKSNFTVMILGETGSGKELVAHAIHNASSFSGGPFVTVDCGAIPETLLESELFGHEKGAFTGANREKPGKFEVARRGTIFLDEISNMPLGSQAKLLRVLQEKKMYRVGGTSPINIHTRVLAASNQNIEIAVKAGAFRNDLFYRLNDYTIKIPPIRERKEDIPYLAKRFLEATNAELGKHVKRFAVSAMNALMAYEWPGNVRELRTVIRRAVLLADEISEECHLNIDRKSAPSRASVQGDTVRTWEGLSLKEIVRQCTMTVERDVLAEALKHAGGNKAKAARMLRIDYKTIHTKIKQLGIRIDGGDNE